MYSLSVIVGPAVWSLMFKTEESIADAEQQLEKQLLHSAENSVITIIDDFGQSISVKGNSFHGMLYENLEETKQAHIERALHEGRVRAKIQQAMQTDPSLRTLGSQGMPILSPMGNGRAL